MPTRPFSPRHTTRLSSEGGPLAASRQKTQSASSWEIPPARSRSVAAPIYSRPPPPQRRPRPTPPTPPTGDAVAARSCARGSRGRGPVLGQALALDLLDRLG